MLFRITGRSKNFAQQLRTIRYGYLGIHVRFNIEDNIGYFKFSGRYFFLNTAY